MLQPEVTEAAAHAASRRATEQVPEFILSMNFAHVAKSGGVRDFADNLRAGMQSLLGPRLTVVDPKLKKGRAAQMLARFLSELALEIRYWRTPAVALFPNYFIFPLPFSRLRRVVVVHDLQFKHYPQYTSAAKRLFLDFCYRITRRYADGVVFISNASMEDFRRQYGEPNNQKVIYNPIKININSDDLANPDEAPPYAIANFHYYPHKNLPRLIEYFQALRSAWPELRLVLTGHKPPEFEKLVGKHPNELGIYHKGFVEKDEVIRLLSKSTFFISLSKFEGFNMSAAEACLLKKPLILSNLPVHRELFTREALFVDSDNDDIPVASIIKFVHQYNPTSIWSSGESLHPISVADKYVGFLTTTYLDRNPKP